MRGYLLVLGTVAAAFWLMLLIGGVLNRGEPITTEGIVAGTFVFLSVIGVGLSYKLRRLGPALLIVAGLGFAGFAYFSASSSKWLAVLTSGVPFMVVGSLLLLTYQFSPKKR